MSDWQEWVVRILIVFCVARMVFSISLFFRRAKKKENPCSSCVSGCELKDLMDEKRKKCQSKDEVAKKKSCG